MSSLTDKTTGQIFLAFDTENITISFPIKGNDRNWFKGTLTIQNFVRACSDPGKNLEQALQDFSLGDSCLFGGKNCFQWICCNEQTFDMTTRESQEEFFTKFLQVINFYIWDFKSKFFMLFTFYDNNSNCYLLTITVVQNPDRIKI